MLKENIKILRKQKGLSQEELSIKLNVVRQTISKWEQGLSVPDAEMLIAISNEFNVSVSTLLGETIEEDKNNELKVISEKLEVINNKLYCDGKLKKKRWLYFFIGICISILIVFLMLFFLKSFYINWDYTDPEMATFGALFHGFEWLFIRIAPVIFACSLFGIIMVSKNK